MESPNQVDINPSKTDLEVQAIAEITIENENSENSNSSNSITKDAPTPMKRKYEDITKDPHFIESGLCPPFIKSLNISDPQRDDHLIDILSTGTFNFKSNLTSLYMIPTDYKFHVKDDRSKEYYTSVASKLIRPYEYWLQNRIKIFSLQFNFLRPSINDMHYEETDPNFLPLNTKKQHHNTYKKFLEHKHPQNYIFVNHKYTSPLTFNTTYHIDPEKTKGKIRNYDPIKQYFILQPKSDPTRPLIVPQEYLINNDDMSPYESIPEKVDNTLPQLKPLLTKPMQENEKLFYQTLAMKRNTYTELLFTVAHLTTYIIKREKIIVELTEKSKNLNTQGKQQENIKEISELLKPFKNKDTSNINAIKYLIDSYEVTNNMIQSLHLESTRIEQSSTTIRNTLDNFITSQENPTINW